MNSAKDLVQSLAASTSDVERAECGPGQDCHDRIKLALFFDGTGNNREADGAEQKWSNVARLFDSARDDPAKGIYARYVSGIGTKLNREEPWWALLGGVRDLPATGGASGWGASARLVSGDTHMNEVLANSLKVASEKAGREVNSVFLRNTTRGFDELNKALANHRLIKAIEVSIFGFSRGAALARAFLNRLVKQCERNSDR